MPRSTRILHVTKILGWSGALAYRNISLVMPYVIQCKTNAISILREGHTHKLNRFCKS